MYRRAAVSKVRVDCRYTDAFNIWVGIHKGLVLTSHLFMTMFQAIADVDDLALIAESGTRLKTKVDM